VDVYCTRCASEGGWSPGDIAVITSCVLYSAKVRFVLMRPQFSWVNMRLGVKLHAGRIGPWADRHTRGLRYAVRGRNVCQQ